MIQTLEESTIRWRFGWRALLAILNAAGYITNRYFLSPQLRAHAATPSQNQLKASGNPLPATAKHPTVYSHSQLCFKRQSLAIPMLCLGKKKTSTSSMTDMQDYIIKWEGGPLGITLRPELGLELPPVVCQILDENSIARLSGVLVGDLLISINGKKTTAIGFDRSVARLYRGKLPMLLHFRSPLKNHFDGGSKLPGSWRHRHLSFGFSNVGHTPILEDWNSTAESLTASDSVRISIPTKKLPPAIVPRKELRQFAEKRSLSDMDYLPGTSNACDDRLQRGFRLDQIKLASGRARERRKHKPVKVYRAVWRSGNLGISFIANSYHQIVVHSISEDSNPNRGEGMDRIEVGDILIRINSQNTKSLGFDNTLRCLQTMDRPLNLRFRKISRTILPSPTSAEATFLCSERSRTDQSEEEHDSVTPVSDSPAIPLKNPPKLHTSRTFTASSQLSFTASMMIVAKSSNKAIQDVEFAGLPLLSIKEESVQAQLLKVYAKACLASTLTPQRPYLKKGAIPILEDASFSNESNQ
uniref:Uncharacterized protein AlNc14C311G10494 n=1 Tax=Albugo laibachii Nc14 TaxID=890382 RepID=F0WW50_9STRA|nr:conserved hypothetical protein [Albugo laibachii Nc14]|eukprot:CCA25658.1 conserved hypothetical protein [Albugo laibachii Nc14]